MSDVALLVGGFVSALACGWGLGRSIKAFRQFMDQI